MVVQTARLSLLALRFLFILSRPLTPVILWAMLTRDALQQEAHLSFYAYK